VRVRVSRSARAKAGRLTDDPLQATATTEAMTASAKTAKSFRRKLMASLHLPTHPAGARFRRGLDSNLLLMDGGRKLPASETTGSVSASPTFCFLPGTTLPQNCR